MHIMMIPVALSDLIFEGRRVGSHKIELVLGEKYFFKGCGARIDL